MSSRAENQCNKQIITHRKCNHVCSLYLFLLLEKMQKIFWPPNGASFSPPLARNTATHNDNKGEKMSNDIKYYVLCITVIFILLRFSIDEIPAEAKFC
jgi:hypothetical protein